MRKSELEERYDRLLSESGLSDGVVRQHKFVDGRGFRYDFAWPAYAVAVEIEGQPFTRPGTFRDLVPEAEKFAHAALLGWSVLRVPAKWLTTPRDTEGECEAIVWTRALLDKAKARHMAGLAGGEGKAV